MSRRARAVLIAVVVGSPVALCGQTHPGGRWWTLETAHFRVHVRPDQRALGARAAGEAEAAYQRLAAELPAPRGKVDLVVTDHVDAGNGFASVFPTPVIVVYAFPPASDLELTTYDRWLRLVITHELAHVFHLDLAEGWWRTARRVFGRAPGLFPNQYAPAWLTEGLAVFYESRLTEAGRLDGSFHRAAVRASAATGRALPIDAAGALSPKWPAGIRPYAFGGTFLGSVARERGDSIVPRLARETARRAVPYLSLNGALKRAAGESFTVAWRAWQDTLAAEVRGTDVLRAPGPSALPAVAVAGESPPATPLLCCLRAAVPPRVSPDGRAVLLARSDGRDASRLVVLHRATGMVRVLSRLNGASGVAWDGAGNAVVAQLEFTDLYTARSDLWRVGPDGRERRLTRGERLSEPDVGPDGAVYAVRAVPGGNELVRWDTTGLRTVVPGAAGVEWAHPRVAPDGRVIAAARVLDGRHDIVLLSSAGEIVREITRDAALDQMPAFSPDGRLLVWSREVRGTPQIVGVPVGERDGALRFTSEAFGAYAPAVAGDTLYYLAYHADGFRLVKVPLAGEAEELAGAPPDLRPPAPAPAAAITREHPYRPFPALSPQYWTPQGVSASGDLVWLGALTSGADALRRHVFVADFLLGVGSARGSWLGDLAYVYAGLSPLLLDASYSRDEIVTGDSLGNRSCCTPDESADLGVTLQHRRYRTTFAARLGATFERTSPFARRGPVLTAAAAHTITPALAISLQDGWRLSALARRWTSDSSRIAYSEARIRGTVAKSFEVAGFARWVLAARGAFAWSNAASLPFDIGGVSGGAFELAPGLTVGSGSRDFPVRGYPVGYQFGRRALSLSVEQRAPLALVGRGHGMLPATLDRVSLALFADAGNTWANYLCPQGSGRANCTRWIGSAGGEIVADVGAGYDVPVRVRLGAAVPLERRTVAAYVAVGSAF